MLTGGGRSGRENKVLEVEAGVEGKDEDPGLGDWGPRVEEEELELELEEEYLGPGPVVCMHPSTVLYCTALHCTVLFCYVLFCTYGTHICKVCAACECAAQ